MGAKGDERGFCLFNDEWPLLLNEEDEVAAAIAAPLPAIDLVEQDGALVLVADVPGIDAGDLDVEVDCEHITISASDRARAAFRRTVALPVEVELADVTAQLKDGVLEVRAHRRTASATIHVGVARA